MAAREGDIALWLHNKLGSTDDLWSGSSICSQLSRDKLVLIQDCFHNLQPHVKVKLLLSFVHLPKRSVEEWKPEMEELIQMAQDDTDQWVTMVGDILKNYPRDGGVDMDISSHQGSFHDIIVDLRKCVRRTQENRMAPLECCYLSRVAQVSVTGQPPQPVKHFALKRKPKSAALRAEILQKSTEAANNLKKNKNKATATTIPVKIRSFAKKMDDTTPMRGLPSTPVSAGFPRSNSLGSRFGGSTILSQRTPSNRREGGIKLLDIKEQPVGAKEAKKRRKIAEQEAAEIQKKEKEAAANTPDYAAGLINPAGLGVDLAAGPSYVPQGATRITAATALGAIPTATQQARDNLQQQLNQQIGTSTTTVSMVTITNSASKQNIVTVVTPQPGTNATVTAGDQQTGAEGGDQSQQANTQARKGLSLTREQMFAAQEMFRTSNKVTRPEKALILGFMAGSRDNPLPQQGDIVNIRLSEDQDSIQQPDSTFKPMMVDTFIQMNYGTGEWKRIKKYRELETE